MASFCTVGILWFIAILHPDGLLAFPISSQVTMVEWIIPAPSFYVSDPKMDFIVKRIPSL